jgi:5-methylcytosine-specific restriction enzyme subunit McrC
MKQQFILSEYSEEFLLEDYELSADEREYLTRTSIIHEAKPWEKRFYFDELKNGVRIKTQSWVGVIELDRVRIIIQPKFNKGFSSLIDMISFIENLPFYQWEDSMGTMHKTDFLEILVRLFLREVEKIL